MLFLLSGLTSALPGTVGLTALLAAVCVAVLREAGVVKFALPQNSRQIPQMLFDEPIHRGAARFGFELSTGVRTYVTSSSPYVLVLVLLLVSPSAWATLAAGLGYGVGHASVPAGRLLATSTTGWDERLAKNQLALKQLGNIGVLLAVFGAAAVIHG
jgi:hypothetical protein